MSAKGSWLASNFENEQFFMEPFLPEMCTWGCNQMGLITSRMYCEIMCSGIRESQDSLTHVDSPTIDIRIVKAMIL